MYHQVILKIDHKKDKETFYNRSSRREIDHLKSLIEKELRKSEHIDFSKHSVR